MSKKQKLQAPTGMHDILPEEQPYVERVYEVAKGLATFYGFSRIDTPVVEDVMVYEKGTGAATDIVEKQMFLLRTKGGDILALRPEFTPGIARAYLQHGMVNLPQPVKLYTSGPLFRYEHPQAGRFRQFHQFDLEVFGDTSPAIDAQVIQIFYSLLKELKLPHLTIEVNSIGDSSCRPYYKKLLVNFLKSRQYSLCADCRRRMKTNPLRVLDCKEEKCQRVKVQAPQIIDHLCDPCKDHFTSLLELLDEADLPYHLDPYLVRGLDYYTKTVFEIVSERAKSQEDVQSQEGKPPALAGGGRFDTLLKVLGNKDVAGSGAAAGIERIVSLMKELGSNPQTALLPKVFFAQLGESAKKKSIKLLEGLREANIPVAESLGRDSLRTQLARADKLGVVLTLILGQREVLDNTIVVRRMESGVQETIKMDNVMEEIKKRLRK